MRRANKEIVDKEQVVALLRTAPVGRLGTLRSDGYPMVKPLNFVCHGQHIYFHGAGEGEKISDIRRHPKVCFEVDLPIGYVEATDDPCGAFFRYRSVIILGKAFVIEDPGEKRFALNALMEKYQPAGGYGDPPAAKLAATAVVRIDIEEMTGKEDLRKILAST